MSILLTMASGASRGKRRGILDRFSCFLPQQMKHRKLLRRPGLLLETNSLHKAQLARSPLESAHTTSSIGGAKEVKKEPKKASILIDSFCTQMGSDGFNRFYFFGPAGVCLVPLKTHDSTGFNRILTGF